MERRTFVGGLPIAAGMVGVISLSAEPSSLDNEKHKAARWRLQNARAFFPKGEFVRAGDLLYRSEEHTSELQSLMRISYAVFCLKKKIIHNNIPKHHKTQQR